MDEQEILQSMIGKTIKSTRPLIIKGETLFIEITFTDNSVIDISAHCNLDTREGHLSFRNITQKKS